MGRPELPCQKPGIRRKDAGTARFGPRRSISACLKLIEGIRWASAHLKDPDTLVAGMDGISLSAINEESEEGKILAASARQILIHLGKGDSDVITTEDTANEAAILAQMKFNGRRHRSRRCGRTIRPWPWQSERSSTAWAPETDHSGKPGISQEKVDRFFAEAQAYAQWQTQASDDPSLPILGNATQAALEILQTVEDKINDYFIRCRLAGFDERGRRPSQSFRGRLPETGPAQPCRIGRAVCPLSPGEDRTQRPLPLQDEINPAWARQMAAFRQDVVVPILGKKENIMEDEWIAINDGFARYAAWCAAKPVTSVEKLGMERIRAILDGGFREAIETLIAKDRSYESNRRPSLPSDKLVRYCRYLHTLINNFTAFRDFYGHQSQGRLSGRSLYLDGRSCDLCVKVEDVAAHAVLATLSRVVSRLLHLYARRRGGKDDHRRRHHGRRFRPDPSWAGTASSTTAAAWTGTQRS